MPTAIRMRASGAIPGSTRQSRVQTWPAAFTPARAVACTPIQLRRPCGRQCAVNLVTTCAPAADSTSARAWLWVRGHASAALLVAAVAPRTGRRRHARICCGTANVEAEKSAPTENAQDSDPDADHQSIKGAAEKRPPLRLDRDDNGVLRSLNVTTPLFYANGSPHIGSAYPTIVSDVLARYGQLRGAKVHFVTGMDEHGEKIARTAADKGTQPQELVDSIAEEFLDLWGKLSIENGHFARTTAKKHASIVAEMWQRCLDNGDIYKKEYSGWYCVGCEAYLDDDEMVPGSDHVCAIHQKPCEMRREENYFFRLSNYWDQVIEHIKQYEDFILPVKRRNEVLYWLREDNKRDFSISRASTKWGIPVPGDESQVIYVWFDALLGYMSSLLRPEDPATLEFVLKRGWPADVHIIGKDIMRFHTIYWPAMLLSAGLPLPKHICTHGFLTKDGLKMGKSLGNVVEPFPLVENFGADAVRFYFSACLSFGEDGDFSYETFIKRVNAALANELGNLVHRILTLCRKNVPDPISPLEYYADEQIAMEHPVRLESMAAVDRVARHFERVSLTLVADTALGIATVANQRMNEVEPWAKLKRDTSDEDKRTAIREMLMMGEGVRICALLLSPLTPDLSITILKELGVAPADGAKGLRWVDTAWCWDALPGIAKGKKPKPVFQRIDLEPWKGK